MNKRGRKTMLRMKERESNIGGRGKERGSGGERLKRECKEGENK